jgi:hypothetical protein
MVLVLAVGLVAGLAVHTSGRYRKPWVVQHAGMSFPTIKVTADGWELDEAVWYYGPTAAAWPIRWKVTVTRVGETKPVCQEDYGTLSKLDPDGVTYRCSLHKTLPLHLAPGAYGVYVETSDGLKVRDKAGKIVDRGMFPSGSSSQRVEVE